MANTKINYSRNTFVWAAYFYFLSFLIFSIFAFFYLKELPTFNLNYLFRNLMVMFFFTIIQFLIGYCVYYLSKQMTAHVPATKFYFALAFVSLIIFLFCFCAYLFVSILSGGNLLRLITLESLFNFGLLAVNIILVFFTGYTLLITNKKMNIELTEKNILSQIEFLRTRLNDYYVPLHSIFSEYLVELNELDIDNLNDDDEGRLVDFFKSKTQSLNIILRQFAYLDSNKLHEDSFKFLLDLSFYLIIKDNDGDNVQNKENFLDAVEKMYPVEINTDRGDIKMATVFEEYYKRFDNNITKDEAFKICVKDINIIIIGLDRAIFATNDQLSEKLSLLSFVRH